jgi:hypothetical protein
MLPILDDVLYQRHARAASAQPGRLRRPPPQKRVGSGIELRQTRNQTDDETNVKVEHRKQQLLRRQRKAAERQVDAQSQSERQVYRQSQLRVPSQGREHKENYGEDPLAESTCIPEAAEDKIYMENAEPVLSPDGTSEMQKDKPEKIAKTSKDKKRKNASPTSVTSKLSSVASQRDTDPGPISSVVIRQPDGIITDHVVNPDQVPGDQDGLITQEDDHVSISSSVLEEQDIDLPSGMICLFV